MVTLQDVKADQEISQMIESANEVLKMYGYTEHGIRHCGYVSECAARILRELDYPERTVELAGIAGWVHDVGNMINQQDHGITGALLIRPMLLRLGMPLDEVAVIQSAVGNHEEHSGVPVSPVSAALIIADKSDAHRTRVRKGRIDPGDLHDRVNYAIHRNKVEVQKDRQCIQFLLEMDKDASIMDFLTIFMTRMIMSEKASKLLGCRFELIINGRRINTGI